MANVKRQFEQLLQVSPALDVGGRGFIHAVLSLKPQNNRKKCNRKSKIAKGRIINSMLIKIISRKSD